MKTKTSTRLLVSISALFLVGTLASLNVTAGAPANYTDKQIEKAAKKARSIKSLTKKLSSEKLLGRDNDSGGSALARDLIIKKLRKVATGPMGEGDAGYLQPYNDGGQIGTNVIGIIPGREIPGEYVVVGAHYDHHGTRSNGSGQCGGGIASGGAYCPGVTDNATGTAAAVAIAKAIDKLPVAPRRSIVIALWDGEEDGLIGSKHYVNNPVVPLEDTVAYINFDIVGSDLLPSVANHNFAISSETGGSGFGDLIDQAYADQAAVAKKLPVVGHRLSWLFGQLRSDYANFVANSVPSVFFGDADGVCYHTTGDTLKAANMEKAKEVSAVGFRTTLELAERVGSFPFVAPPAPFATYDDAVVLNEVVQIGLADLGLFQPAEQATLTNTAAAFQGLVDDGPGLFDASDASASLSNAISLVSTITTLPCGAF